MKTFRTSLHELNNMHPLLAAPTIGLFAVGLSVLALPTLITRPDAWGLFVTIGLGGGLGVWIRSRARAHGGERAGQHHDAN